MTMPSLEEVLFQRCRYIQKMEGLKWALREVSCLAVLTQTACEQGRLDQEVYDCEMEAYEAVWRRLSPDTPFPDVRREERSGKDKAR